MTQRLDCFGNEVSVEDGKTLASIDDFAEGFLAYETRAENIIAAADAAPDACIANVYAGLLWMLLESPEAAAHAQKYLLRAHVAAPRALPREQASVAVLEAWAHDDLAAAMACCERITLSHPHDLVIAKLSQYFDFNRGDFPGMLRTALRVLDANPEVAYAHGMAAFGYEQCHLVDAAEKAARRALDLRAKEPWAQHSLAHVYLSRGEIDAGAAFMESVAPTWVGLNSFMYTHNWWHLALFYLSQGREREVLAIYDERCWSMAKTYSQDQAGAVSLLARIEIAGIDVGDRWIDLGRYLAARAHDTVQPFLTMQYLYGLARAGRAEADELMTTVRRYAADAPPFAREAWHEVALPACEGLLAHGRGDFETAQFSLGKALPLMIETGGSHAQRDVFEQIWLDAMLRGGRLMLAQQHLELRRRTDPDGVPLNRMLAEVYVKLGLPEQAAIARDRQRRTLAKLR